MDLRRTTQGIVKHQAASQAVPIQKHWKPPIARPRFVQQHADIVHKRFEAGRVAARTTGPAMPAQVEADQGKSGSGKRFADRRIARNVLAQPVHQCEDRRGLHIRLPTLQLELDS
jgi:hypothetical protein